MFSKLKQKSEFSRNVLRLMTDITIAQAIPTAVHYPLHLQECFEYGKGDFAVTEKVSDEIMSLPMNPYLSDDEIGYIIKRIKNV